MAVSPAAPDMTFRETTWTIKHGGARGENGLQGRSLHAEHFRDHRRIDQHMRCDSVVADGVDPGVAGAQRYDCLDHAGTEILETNKNQRQRHVSWRTEHRPAF